MSRTVSRWARLAARAHRRYHVPTRLLLGLIETESGGREGLVSSASAKGLTQFIPGTARSYHVNTSPGHARSQIMGAAHYLSDLRHQTGSLHAALYRYSGGSSSYPGLVRSRARGYTGVAKRANRGVRGLPVGGGRGGSRRGRPRVLSRAQVSLIPGAAVTPGGAGVAALLSRNLEPAVPQVSVTPPAEPSFSAHNRLALPEGYGGTVGLSTGAPVQQQDSLAEQLRQIQSLSGSAVPKPRVQITGRNRVAAGKATPIGKVVSSDRSVVRRTERGRYKPPALLELFWQGAGGINVKHGRVVPQGFVSGHRDHVHVASTRGKIVKIGRLAQRMDLHVGENPHFGGVNPVHISGSYHYSDRAIDVSGSPATMRRFAHTVARIYGIR